MQSPAFMENPDYTEYVRLLRRLHEMRIQGLDQDDESDEIRDRMDGPWSRMSREEIQRADNLSADLYTISEQISSASVPLDRAEWQLRYEEIRSKEDFEGFLALIREDPGPFTRPLLAYMRALSWFGLHDPESALLFIEEAAKLRPTDYDIATLRFQILEKLGREDQALNSLADFAETNPDRIPERHRDTLLKVIEERKKVVEEWKRAEQAMKETTGRLYESSRILLEKATIPAA